MDQRNRFLGAMFGLAYGDALSFPALFHRFQTMPRRRHNFLWRRNSELDEQGITRLMLPFTHRLSATDLEIYPTDDTEFALLTLMALLATDDEPHKDSFLRIWQERVLPVADKVRSSFSERAALENLKRGLEPPTTGNDNPLHYEDCAVARAVPIGLYCAGDEKQAAQLAQWDAQISQAEDGIYAAQGMAVAVALLADGAALDTALDRAREEYPVGSWIRHIDRIVEECLVQAGTPEDLILLLDRRVINTVYSYGNAAPETLPSALAITLICAGDLQRAVPLANTLAKAADSLPAMVGALCGIHQGIDAISPLWREALSRCRGVCLPFMQGVEIEDLTLQLLDRARSRG